jgi:hypothetical protein
MIESLHSQIFGGYNKLDTLLLAENLMVEIESLEEAVEHRNAQEDFELPPPAKEVSLRRTLIGGFALEDVDTFIGELRAKISELRGELATA